jgi:hypothetical protein
LDTAEGSSGAIEDAGDVEGQAPVGVDRLEVGAARVPQQAGARSRRRLDSVAAHGMVRPSFVPPQPIRELRELTRYR